MVAGQYKRAKRSAGRPLAFPTMAAGTNFFIHRQCQAPPFLDVLVVFEDRTKGGLGNKRAK